jgi:NADPH-dependent stearoyl-CoA 9-desaturase
MTSAAAHLTDQQVEDLGAELDAIRAEVVDEPGESDARYIHRVVAAQRGLEAGGRGLLLFSPFPPAWLAGTAALSVAKILENMELGHNIMHGQWDWMRDRRIHSTTWEWDHASPSESWKKSHNYEHHTFTNVRGKDRDLGYDIVRIAPEQPWKPIHLLQPIYNMGLALVFEWGVALYDLEIPKAQEGGKPWSAVRAEAGRLWRKARRQLGKDYVLFPLLSGPGFLSTLAANATANATRNVWAHAVIFCGHFPDGTETFEEERLDGETKGQWYVRQLLGSANLSGGPLFHVLTGNLSHQIEHHLFPDVPSNRYAEIAPRVREICERYGLPYTTGRLSRQYGTVLRKIARFALPGGGPAAAAAPVAPLPPAQDGPAARPARLAS